MIRWAVFVRTPSWFFASLVCGALGCSSSSDGGRPAADGGAEPHPDGGAHGDAAAPPPDGGPGEGGVTACTDDTTGLPAEAVCILHVTGRAVDETGAPVESGLLVSACGPAQCNPGFTDADGSFRIDVGLHLVPRIYSVQVHVRPDRAAFYYALPPTAAGPDIDMGELRVLPMPPNGPAIHVDRAGTPAQSVTSGDVTLEVADGVYVSVDVESNLAGAHGKEFRAERIPDAFLDEYADPSLGIQALYALEPFECSFELPGTPTTPTDVRLSFANSAGLPASASVDLLALGSYIYPDWIPPAHFTPVAKGHVSADGAWIQLDPGEGVPYLTWVGLRVTP